MNAKTGRERHLDEARGLLIALVVIGHLVSGSVTLPEDLRWYGTMRQIIYLFHMPGFFFVSGILFALLADRWTGGIGETGRQIMRRADRLLVPYVGMGLFILFGKYTAAAYIQVDNFIAAGSPGAALANGLYVLFIDTANSPAGSIWFLFAYFLCVACALPLARLRHGAWAMLALAMAAYIAPRLPLFYLDKLAENAIFFALGWLYRSNPVGAARIKAAMPVWAIMTILLLLLGPAIRIGSLMPLWYLLFGCGGAVVILWTFEQTSSPLLLRLGQASMIIYVFNTPIIGLVRAAFVKLQIFESAFGIFLIVASIAAIAIPMAIRRGLVMRTPLLAKYLA